MISSTWAQVSDSGASCPYCGAMPSDAAHSLPVEVLDPDMKFGTIFWFLIKVSFAAVPAVIVIYAAWTVIGGALSPSLHIQISCALTHPFLFSSKFSHSV